MEIQLNELIEQIKKDGVTAAEAQAADIIKSAKSQAEKIVADAKSQAEKIMADAKEENARNAKVSEDAIRQAGRNLLISFRDSVSRELCAIIGEKVSDVYNSEAFSDIVVKALTALAENDGAEVLLNTEDTEKLKDTLLSALKDKLKNGATIKPNDDFDGGFRVCVNNGTAYYDYSKEAVTDMLASYLTPKVTQLMKEAE